jgi:hypothetical protein
LWMRGKDTAGALSRGPSLLYGSGPMTQLVLLGGMGASRTRLGSGGGGSR